MTPQTGRPLSSACWVLAADKEGLARKGPTDCMFYVIRMSTRTQPEIALLSGTDEDPSPSNTTKHGNLA